MAREVRDQFKVVVFFAQVAALTLGPFVFVNGAGLLVDVFRFFDGGRGINLGLHCRQRHKLLSRFYPLQRQKNCNEYVYRLSSPDGNLENVDSK